MERPSELGHELALLRTLDRAALALRWKEVFGQDAPSKTAQALMVMALSYKLQESARGGLRPAYRRRLLQSVDTKRPDSNGDLRPGTVLIREWHGITYSVTILDKGVVMQGRHYRSLTEVARFITGTHQSGPIFFGLRGSRPS